jgi:hypothetical protein
MIFKEKKMMREKKKEFLKSVAVVTAMMALLAAIGLTMAACNLEESEPTVDPGSIGTPESIAVEVTFENVKDAEIITGDLSLREDGDLTVTVRETFEAYAWYINGVLADDDLVSDGGKTITLNGGDLNFGNNRLSVRVTASNGVIYSKTVIVTVED